MMFIYLYRFVLIYLYENETYVAHYDAPRYAYMNDNVIIAYCWL